MVVDPFFGQLLESFGERPHLKPRNLSSSAEETSEEVDAENIHNQEENLNRHPDEPNNVIPALKRLLGTTTSRPRETYKIPSDVLTNRKAASELYQRNPKKLVDILMTESVEVASPSEDQKNRIVENLSDKLGFKTTEQSVGDFDRRKKYGDKVHRPFSILYPPTEAEIKAVITTMKDSSAPGPDGITVKQLKKKLTQVVKILKDSFNRCFLELKIPDELKVAKTTMILKH
ncbi:hypothetical protein SNEBB_002780, partial [Seison nebaliae]